MTNFGGSNEQFLQFLIACIEIIKRLKEERQEVTYWCYMYGSVRYKSVITDAGYITAQLQIFPVTCT